MKENIGGVIKSEILDHFPIFLITDPITSSEIKNKRTFIYKRTINTATKENFKKTGKKNLGLFERNR